MTTPAEDNGYEQLGLLPSQAVARRTDPGTSWAAARAAEPLRQSQLAVLDFFRLVGKPMTDERLEEEYPQWARSYSRKLQSPSGLRTRRRELTDAGYVRDTGRRVRNSRGNPAIVWALAQAPGDS